MLWTVLYLIFHIVDTHRKENEELQMILTTSADSETIN